jgi:uncharacterized membrane protein YfcA
LRAVDLLLLGLVGLGGGLAGSIAGIASLVVYPSLLALGLPPVAANVTATVANVFGGVGSSVGSRAELTGQRRRVRRLGVICALGGVSGGALLLASSSATFERVVPWLVGAASVAIVSRPPARRATAGPDDPRLLTVVAFLVAVYGGYFGAAAGVLMLAALLLLTPESIARATGTKNVIMTCANGVAAIAFMAFGPVRWDAVIPLSVGFLAGGRIGPLVVRRMPVGPLRLVIAACGLGLAVHLGLDAYGLG